MTLDVQVEGEGRPVVLLHGFPDTKRLWSKQVPALVDAGFQVIVPDQRGYGASDKPTEVEAYSIPFLAIDVTAILDHLGIERAHVVGHDWGSAIAWATASFAPERVDHLVALSVGHPTAFATAGMLQREKSWYMLLFQFRDIAEQWLTMNDWANFREWSHHPDADAVIADLDARQLADARARLVPRQHPAGGARRPAARAAAGAVAHDGRVEQRRLRAARSRR